MGEVAVSNEKEAKNKRKEEEKSGGCEGFLPRMFLRVLLIEGDDSTRHIISALLRKCSYKGQFRETGSSAFSVASKKKDWKANNIIIIF